jgi:hypothetical protein
MSLEPLETAEGSDFPLCRQQSVFLENRLGQLLRLTRLFAGSDIHIRGLSVEGSIDCAIVRLIVDDPDGGAELLSEARFPVTETEILIVELPPGKRGIMSICAALIAGEVNINYMYPLLPGPKVASSIAIQVDNPPTAATVLKQKQFRVLTQSEI